MPKQYNHFFLDRDGVINKNAFVNHPSEFEFIDGALEAFRLLKDYGCQSFVVTNQGGIEMGYLSETTLLAIHAEMLKAIDAAGGGLDGIYYCPHLKVSCECRKPQPGLIEKAIEQHYLTRRRKDSCFIGDYITDWQAAEAAGIQPIAVKTGRYAESPKVAEYVAEHEIPLYDDLLAAVEALADTIPF